MKPKPESLLHAEKIQFNSIQFKTEMMSYQPYFDPDFDPDFLIERIHPPRVCIDNDSSQDCTLVKVDGVNKNGILLEIAQVLTELDLVISKAYISSDGGWFMDVFHVTDQLGDKLTDQTLILYIEQALCSSRRRRGGISKEVEACPCPKNNGWPRHVSTDHTAVEMTGVDRPGLLSKMSAVLSTLECPVTAAMAWTHNGSVACITYIEDGSKGGGRITDPIRLAHIEEQLEIAVEAHHEEGERRSVRLTTSLAGGTHTERRLHQLMFSDRDYELYHGCDGSFGHWRGCSGIHVGIESCDEKGYSVVNVRSPDRAKLLFDTVCAITELRYVVFHAAVSSKGGFADQEYFIQQEDGRILDTEIERQRLVQCLIAAIERRNSHGSRLDICSQDRPGLLSDVSRVFHENGLSISRAEIWANGETVTGIFYATDASGHEVNSNTVALIREELGGSNLVVNNNLQGSESSVSRTASSGGSLVESPKSSLGRLLWSQLGRTLSNFGSSIRG